jgi:hypothetical protein
MLISLKELISSGKAKGLKTFEELRKWPGAALESEGKYFEYDLANFQKDAFSYRPKESL